MAYLRNRGSARDPSWYVRYRDSDGKWKERPTHQATKEAAKRYAAEVEARVARGAIGMPEPSPAEMARKALTVGDLAASFLGDAEGVAGYAPPRIKDLASYRGDVRSAFKARILPALGARAASSVTTAEIERLRDSLLARGLAAATAVQSLAMLSKLYNWGRKVGLLDCANPVQGVERPRTAQSVDFLSHAEVVALLAHAEAEAHAEGATWEARVRYPMAATAVHCGLRKGELFGLRWIDVHLDAGRLGVLRSYRLAPKSGKPRHVPIHPELAPVLRRWRDECPRVAEGLVFPVDATLRPGRGRPEPGRFRMGAKEDAIGIVPTLVAAGCHLPTDGHAWHMMRHTFAAHFMMSGGNLFTLQRLLGHASPQMTQRYAHLAPEFLGSEVARMSFAPAAPEGVADLGEARRRRAINGDPE